MLPLTISSPSIGNIDDIPLLTSLKLDNTALFEYLFVFDVSNSLILAVTNKGGVKLKSDIET